jgi:acetoin utilization deacetylase AcuC-like enzyme
VLLFTHEACAGHIIEDHPEQPARVPSIVHALTKAFSRTQLEIDEQPPKITDEQLLLFHSQKHIDTIFLACHKAEKNLLALKAKAKVRRFRWTRIYRFEVL